jgi:hypothetical protein
MGTLGCKVILSESTMPVGGPGFKRKQGRVSAALRSNRVYSVRLRGQSGRAVRAVNHKAIPDRAQGKAHEVSEARGKSNKPEGGTNTEWGNLEKRSDHVQPEHKVHGYLRDACENHCCPDKMERSKEGSKHQSEGMWSDGFHGEPPSLEGQEIR